jgi:hypothetical protein
MAQLVARRARRHPGKQSWSYVQRTSEVFRGPGAVVKVMLAGDADDEMSVGMVLQP